ncbi:DNA-binding response regulator, OmpR family, contains REC and winged-helix (wHTH) domain [Paenibacillus tianmuensis]|uniref:DNA-binding response regulator, OmpR family, contains REC and winged-helix (WHTH) domain n=1 Tax=Paenibacillus tianmuensis TaxID=624147 RepID=A0A1G4TK12_9BACL|nr:winged helix family transcriptional regulator [Paenibacillus tianmuensis]SCW81696.1 DNA-binding response regulator, OmpR family, contains REC and winged-helix (wHTH) domain [Paenibacillus tianmuensis]
MQASERVIKPLMRMGYSQTEGGEMADADRLAERPAAPMASSTGETGGTRPFLCIQTKRVAVISPFPGSLHPLINGLAGECYDVLVFHRFEAQIMNALAVDLFVFDVTTADWEGVAGIREALASDSKKQDRSVLLVGEREMADNGFAGLGELLPWPTGLQEAMYRIECKLSGLADAEEGNSVGSFKDLQIDIKKMTVQRGGVRIECTKTEYEILLMLLEAQGAVMSRDEIMDRIWGSSFAGGSNVVDVHVKSLRKKLGDNPAAPQYIATVRGVGYRLAD